MIIGVLKEPSPETRVSLLPDHLSKLKTWQAEVLIEPGAGANSYAPDEQYTDVGGKITDRKDILQQADIILSIHLPEVPEIEGLRGKILLGIYQPLYQIETFQKIAGSGATIFSMDMLPRTTRAQTMDVLSSQANISGYKSVLVAANMFPRYFPMFMTAAGSIPPAKVLILGAGVAGLQAIATARRLGAVVQVFDTRPAVKEEVNSLGAKFIEVEGAMDASQAGGYAVEQSDEFKERQKQKIAEAVQKSDIIITTAQIFGKKAPVLITKEMISTMKHGSVIIDVAAGTGGNTELTKDGETVISHGVSIAGQSNLPATMPSDASKLYGKNISNFLNLLVTAEGKLEPDFSDELVKGACMIRDGKIIYDRLK